MEAEQGTESAVLEPANEKLPVFRVIGITLEESTDVGRPPRDTAHGHVESCSYLHSERLECRRSVAGPDRRAIALAACPPRAA